MTKWHRDRHGEWHQEQQPPTLLDELMRLLVWLIPAGVVLWTVLLLMERKP